MDRAVYPGTFDPVTYGHLDVIRRGARLFEELVVAVSEHPEKHPLFGVKDRAEMVREAAADIPNVRVETFTGLAVDFVRSSGASVILRGIRTVSDFEYEFQMALTNRQLADDVETLFVMSDQLYAHFSARLIREVAARGSDISLFVPPSVASRVQEKLRAEADRGNEPTAH
jgi:pantetheine-phosphate adenylyltransferase